MIDIDRVFSIAKECGLNVCEPTNGRRWLSGFDWQIQNLLSEWANAFSLKSISLLQEENKRLKLMYDQSISLISDLDLKLKEMKSNVDDEFPPILDACCGGRMFWWNKENPDALFMDCREVERGVFQNGWNPNWCVKPDEIADFRDMPFPDNVFKMVVFDPPHLTSGSMKSVINKKYGLLNKETWKDDIVAGFTECWRVLSPGGVLIFKWNEANIKAKELLRSFPAEPLFGDFTGKTGSTIWVTYLKTPNALGNRLPASGAAKEGEEG